MKAKKTARQAAEYIIHQLAENGFTALLAGGCVRDELLGIEPKDFDVATNATPDEVRQLFRRTEMVGAKFGVVLVRKFSQMIEVATFRKDGVYSDGRHPDNITLGTIDDDARRRDFTINGMFHDIIADRIIDNVGGRDDLAAKLVRAIGDPGQRLREDHLRMLRAVRFAARLEFSIEAQTHAAIRSAADKLSAISTERVREELRLILTHANRADGWRMLVSTGLVGHIFAEYNFDLATHEVEQRLSALPAESAFHTALACLLIELEPRRAERMCRTFSSPNTEARAVGWLLSHLPRVREAAALELADVKLLAADDRFQDLLALLRACLSADGHSLDAFDCLTQRVAEIPPEHLAPSPLITGADLIARKIPQGPIYARTLEALYRAQLNGELNSREEALRRLDELVNG